MASSRIIAYVKYCFSICALVVGYAAIHYAHILRLLTVCSDSDNDSDRDLESTDSEWIDISDPRREQVGVDNDDDINSGSEPVA